MSCGSTLCITRYEIPASKRFAGFEQIWQKPSEWLARISDGCERNHQRRQLLELSDRLLADIGLSREQAVEETCKSFWIGATVWRL
jgi:uncharacterized protein YjiS (DUF1127 family)